MTDSANTQSYDRAPFITSVESLYLLPPGACIIKLITAVIYVFRNKLEYLSLNNRVGWKGLPGTNTLAFYVNRKLLP